MGLTVKWYDVDFFYIVCNTFLFPSYYLFQKTKEIALSNSLIIYLWFTIIFYLNDFIFISSTKCSHSFPWSFPHFAELSPEDLFVIKVEGRERLCKVLNLIYSEIIFQRFIRFNIYMKIEHTHSLQDLGNGWWLTEQKGRWLTERKAESFAKNGIEK